MPSNGGVTRFWQGNQACAEGALAAGCRFFAGYPITPASEIAEFMASELPRLHGVYLQMEDEIGAISAVIGASWGGMMSMTATSGPGFSLMQENIGYAIMTETPCVIVNVQRVGPSTGQATKSAQGDLMQSRWGTHGDHESVVLAPSSAQETFELTVKAFSISEALRHPVILLSDEVVAHSREKVVVDPSLTYDVRRRLGRKGEPHQGGTDCDGRSIMPRFGDGHNLMVTGSTHDERGFRKTSEARIHDLLVRRLKKKVDDARMLLVDNLIEGPPSADWGIISFGCTSRTVDEVMTIKPSTVSIRSMKLRTVWPFPEAEVRAFSETVNRILVPELNLGQLSGEVIRSVRGRVEVVPLNKVGGGLMIEPDELVAVLTGGASG
ncbi:MAG: 2-oxoacid:acceptor oxidoreductase subunit alpha [Candidatus Thorarchaeota archaeon]|nr:2-oxoacid:acceptor oxidoreductase subunit alpha [Candidatus Thorarchaeota archaeon]